MKLLENETLKLRALERDDLDLLFSVENNSAHWEVSDTLSPFSRDVLLRYIENAHLDLFEAKQLRLVITRTSDKCVLGLIDLFDFNPNHKRAGIGILILNQYKRKGYASEALDIFINYVFGHLDLHQIYASIPLNNKASMSLFKTKGFQEIGIQKEWIRRRGEFEHVALYQKINPDHK
ncbi:MAG: GNAT family N-acetyltransferase [Flavobacteriaceae bacterium]|nr:MAG: GNAT family N-acetyltransferase [Flavobacteriaceae bacterium]